MPVTLKPIQHDQMIGQKLGGYTMTRCVGKGGMGMVYEAKHQRMSQRAAVKVLNPALSADPKVLQRFFNEAKALSLVQHPSVVKVFEFGQLDNGTAFIMMEFLDGEPLANCLALAQQEGQGLPLPLAVALGMQIAAALAASHAKGVVHRDLKPENVFLVPDPLVARGQRVKLLDFGIAKFLEGAARKTTIGMILGTPLYMAPEQCEGSQELDAKVDVYALGVMLYEMISGHLPFGGDTTAAIMRQHLFKEPPALAEQRTELPVALTKLVHRMLAKQPGERPTMPEVYAAMDELLPPADQNPSGLRQELALHLAVDHQHHVGPEDAATNPLAQTIGDAPQAETVTPVGLVRPTPVTAARTSRLPLLLGAMLALALAAALMARRLPPRSPPRAAAGPIARFPALAPVPTVASAVAPPAIVLGVTPKPELPEPAEATADLAATKPAGRSLENGPEERKSRPKVSMPRASSPKPPAAAHGAPAGGEDESEQAWR